MIAERISTFHPVTFKSRGSYKAVRAGIIESPLYSIWVSKPVFERTEKLWRIPTERDRDIPPTAEDWPVGYTGAQVKKTPSVINVGILEYGQCI